MTLGEPNTNPGTRVLVPRDSKSKRWQARAVFSPTNEEPAQFHSFFTLMPLTIHFSLPSHWSYKARSPPLHCRETYEITPFPVTQAWSSASHYTSNSLQLLPAPLSRAGGWLRYSHRDVQTAATICSGQSKDGMCTCLSRFLMNFIQLATLGDHELSPQIPWTCRIWIANSGLCLLTRSSSSHYSCQIWRRCRALRSAYNYAKGI